MPWLFILFVVVPAFELYLLIQLSALIGGFETFGVIVATGLLGSYMAKTQGLAVWAALNKKLSSGAIPGDELTDGAIILVSGTLLITPGVLTDIVGFLGLIPWTRSLLRMGVKHFFKGRATSHMSFGTFGGSFTSGNPSGMNTAGNSPHEMNFKRTHNAHSRAQDAQPSKSTSPDESSNGGSSNIRPAIEVSGTAKSRPTEK